jgi:hypothetical protein
MAKVALTPQQMGVLTKAQAALSDVLGQIDKLESCGQECQTLRDAVATTLQHAANLKANFSPPQFGPIEQQSQPKENDQLVVPPEPVFSGINIPTKQF